MEEMLLHTENIDEATAEVEAAGGHILLQLGHNLLVAKVLSHAANQNSFSQASVYIPSSVSAETLSHASAYWMAREDELKPQPTVQKWTERTAPMVFEREASDEGFRGASPYRPTMTGKIAVGIMIVSGPGSLAISSNDKVKIKSECQAGLKFWSKEAKKEGVSLSFALYYETITINASNPTSCSSFRACENVFTDPILQALGFSTGWAGRNQLAQHIKGAADGAFVTFFSKYRQSHVAYAYYSGGPVYIQYDLSVYPTFNRVFAHETGHIFNARDEYYGTCNCNKLYGKGSCTAKNSNCYSCTSSQTDCIMLHADPNEGNLCKYTKKHVGWC